MLAGYHIVYATRLLGTRRFYSVGLLQEPEALSVDVS